MDCDVAVIGGGPAGSTVATLLKTYDPRLHVVVLERERFPRDHVGESLLPPVSQVLDEMGCFEKIDAAGFPIKIGATYRWGRVPELWDLNFIPAEVWVDAPRPQKFEGLRVSTAFQVDRALYDQILLDHAAEVGVEVRQETKVAKVHREGDRVTGLELAGGDSLAARHYIDASGNSGVLRRAMDVPCTVPPSLKNIAVYDYWQNADWSTTIGAGATRILVLTVGYGWIWFIPLGPTRTSIGLVVPADHPRATGKTTEELYREAVLSEPRLCELLKNATSEGKLTATKDWSFLAERQCGENWYLVGEAAGFADPILAAGVGMAHIGARQLAYTILETERGGLDARWLRSEYEKRQKQRIETHIRFGDYWYAANAQFKELKEHTTELAAQVGLDLTPDNAWKWIAWGGFIGEDLTIGTGGFALPLLRKSGGFLADVPAANPLDQNNVFELNLDGAKSEPLAVYAAGRVRRAEALRRGRRVLPLAGAFGPLVNILREEKDVGRVFGMVQSLKKELPKDPGVDALARRAPEFLEAMVRDGWVKARRDPRRPLYTFPEASGVIDWNTDQPKA